MAIRIDHNNTSSRYDVPDGTYETIIESISFDKTFSGTEYIKVALRVRSDVSQPEQGETIDYPLWKSKPENARPSDVHGVPVWQFNQLSKCARLDNDVEYDTIDDLFKALTGKPILVTIEQNDKGYAKVRRIEESLYPQVATGFIPVSDKEPLPF